MTCKILKSPTKEDWALVKDLALGTVGLQAISYPTDEWKQKILLSEHSPIRALQYTWEWTELPSWVSVHLVRHKIGIEHFVQSQRNDRQKDYDRNKAPQDSPVLHRCTADAQAIINISKRRLCYQASEETRQAWMQFINCLSEVEPLLAKLCVPTCIYKGGVCPEFKCCGYNSSEVGRKYLEAYTILHPKNPYGGLIC